MNDQIRIKEPHAERDFSCGVQSALFREQSECLCVVIGIGRVGDALSLIAQLESTRGNSMEGKVKVKHSAVDIYKREREREE